MTNTIAIGLGVLILAGLAVDVAIFGNEHLIFMAKKLDALIEWLAFWR
ncbi:MAG: hypothetical protein AAGA05_07885 [Pseudomonadota bacterium]